MVSGPRPSRDALRIAQERENLLINAAREARRRKLYDFPIVDMDCHVNESSFLTDIAAYIESPTVRRLFERLPPMSVARQIMPGTLGDRTVGARIVRSAPERSDIGHPDLGSVQHAMQHLAIDYACVFPTNMLVLGTHPLVEVEVTMARAFNHYLCERVLDQDRRCLSMLYLPVGDPDAALRMIEDFGHRKGVIGFMVTTVRHTPVHHNTLMKVYAALQERGLVLAFHAGPNWGERPFEQFNRFISVHALTFPLYAMVHMTNLVINGIPERFPRLKFIFMEAGVSWLPFMMYRLDNEYMMRSSEAPLLKKKPSEYIRDFYFTTQPLDLPENPEHARAFLEMINGENRLLYASDYPHWDFDLPSTVWDLPFVSEAGKKKILGGNAMELFGLPQPELQPPPPEI